MPELAAVTVAVSAGAVRSMLDTQMLGRALPRANSPQTVERRRFDEAVSHHFLDFFFISPDSKVLLAVHPSTERQNRTSTIQFRSLSQEVGKSRS